MTLFLIAVHMFLSNHMAKESFNQGELIPSGNSQYLQEATE